MENGQRKDVEPGGKAIGGSASVQVRDAIAHGICAEIARWEITQVAAAKRLGINRSRLNRLLNGDLERFAVDGLIDLAHAAGIGVQIFLVDPARVPFARDTINTGGGLLFDWAALSRSVDPAISEDYESELIR